MQKFRKKRHEIEWLFKQEELSADNDKYGKKVIRNKHAKYFN